MTHGRCAQCLVKGLRRPCPGRREDTRHQDWVDSTQTLGLSLLGCIASMSMGKNMSSIFKNPTLRGEKSTCGPLIYQKIMAKVKSVFPTKALSCWSAGSGKSYKLAETPLPVDKLLSSNGITSLWAFPAFYTGTKKMGRSPAKKISPLWNETRRRKLRAEGAGTSVTVAWWSVRFSWQQTT